MFVYSVKNNLDTLYSTIYELEDIIITLPLKVIDYKPLQGSWSIREHLTHLCDRELEAYYRLTRTFTPDNTVERQMYINSMQYDHTNLYVILDTIRKTRAIIYKTLRWLNHSEWEELTIADRFNKKELLHQWVDNFILHQKEHKEMIMTILQYYQTNDAIV